MDQVCKQCGTTEKLCVFNDGTEDLVMCRKHYDEMVDFFDRYYIFENAKEKLKNNIEYRNLRLERKKIKSKMERAGKITKYIYDVELDAVKEKIHKMEKDEFDRLNKEIDDLVKENMLQKAIDAKIDNAVKVKEE